MFIILASLIKRRDMK